jgi:hypothetical protein
MNTSYIIKPFKTENNAWTFETPIDQYPHLPKRSLDENELVAGMDMILDYISENFENFAIQISSTKIPHGPHTLGEIRLTWDHGDPDAPEDGNWYRTDNGHLAWLCEVLLDYFDSAPNRIYIQIISP